MLAVPDPRVAPIPPGWAMSVAVPIIEACDTQDALDELEQAIRTVLAYVEAVEGDKVELLRAWRFVEARRGQLLGPAKHGGDRKSERRADQVSQAELDRESRPTVSRYRQIAEHWDDLKEHVLTADNPKELTQTHLLRLIREHTPAQPDPTVSDLTSNEVTLLHGDFRERLAELPDGSVDLIVTDPPYPKEDLPLWSDLGALAARVLGPRGILFAWTGQLFLPEVMGRLDEHLNYGWMMCLLMDNPGQSRIMGRHIIQSWKPILAYTPGTWPSGEWQQDVIRSAGRDKSDYEWQQDEYPASEIIQRYSPPGGLIVDPFLGVGSFGRAAVGAGRRFIGVELDASRFKKAGDRIR